MGQSHSAEAATAATPEQLSTQLARRFAEKCFTPLELTHFKDNFSNLADEQDGLQYWKEDTLCRFLQIPDALGVNHVLGQMMAYLGAWPFTSLAPAIMTRESLCKVVVLLTKRYERVLKQGKRDRNRIMFRALAVYDRQVIQMGHAEPSGEGSVEAKLRDAQLDSPRNPLGFSVDQPGLDEEDEDEDELALAALESLDAIEVFQLEKMMPKSEENRLSRTQIPVDNFRSVILLLLLIAPLREQGGASHLAKSVSEDRLRRIQQAANSVLWAFSPERHAGITYTDYKYIIDNSLPLMLDGFDPLFEEFTFSKYLDLSKRRRQSSTTSSKTSYSSDPKGQESESLSERGPQPVLTKSGDILDDILLCQISFFIPSTTVFQRLRLLYAGSSDGFSIHSFEQKVLNWRAPTIVLVQGSRVEASDDNNTNLHSSFPTRRHSPSTSGSGKSDRLTFGALVNQPWKHTHKGPFGDDSGLLFQLEPVHTVFRASKLNHDYVTLTKSGVAFGSPMPRDKPVSGLSDSGILPLGAVSLTLDESLEKGVFMHDAAGGGAYATSRSRSGVDGGQSWEERFDVEHVEVWGCGGDEVAKEQRERWQWEEREAEARRGVVKPEDKEQAYALLEMAGLVNQNRSGGSMA